MYNAKIALWGSIEFVIFCKNWFLTRIAIAIVVARQIIDSRPRRATYLTIISKYIVVPATIPLGIVILKPQGLLQTGSLLHLGKG